MATVSGIHAITSGIAQLLSRAYQLRPISGISCKFEPLGVSDLKKLDGQDTKVTLMLYRISHNEHLRNRPPATLPFGKPAPLTVNAPDVPYTIGPLDTLNIVVWRNPDVSSTVSVRPDGFISAPLVADTPAAGRTPADLSRELEKSLSKYIRDPVVTVVVQKFQGMYANQVRIVGEAAKPQAIAYRQSMTMLDVMIEVGGMTDFADGNNFFRDWGVGVCRKHRQCESKIRAGVVHAKTTDDRRVEIVLTEQQTNVLL
jgi:putative polysaccharide export protein (PEP-CTERM system associated)